MINLLPPREKEELLQEENWRLILNLGIFFLSFLICFSLILFIAKNFISGEVEYQKVLFNQKEKEFKDPQMQTLQENIITFNQTLTQLDSFYQSQFDLNEILGKISKTLSLGTYLTNLSVSPYPKKEGGEEDWRATCNLSGFSPNRENLLKFKENLEKEGLFGNIYFPPASWVKPIDINFIVTFAIK